MSDLYSIDDRGGGAAQHTAVRDRGTRRRPHSDSCIGGGCWPAGLTVADPAGASDHEGRMAGGADPVGRGGSRHGDAVGRGRDHGRTTGAAGGRKEARGRCRRRLPRIGGRLSA